MVPTVVLESADQAPHLVRMLLGVVFDGLWCTAVAVALAQHGIHGAAHDLGVFRFDLLFLIGLRVFGQMESLTSFFAWSSAMAALSCGTDAEMWSLMMFVVS